MDLPNIVFLLSDEHNAKCLGAAGHPFVRTPNLDRLAAGGVMFRCAVAQNPICTPTRISFASGQYPHNHGYYGLAAEQMGPDLLAALPHVYGHFRQAGYYVAQFGKVHVPPGWIDDGCDIRRHMGEGYAEHRSRHWLAFISRHASAWQKLSFYLFGAPFIAMRILLREGRKGNWGAVKGLFRGILRSVGGKTKSSS